MLKFISTLLVLLTINNIYATDKIVRTNGKIINCTITSIDSVYISFILKVNDTEVITKILKDSVQSYGLDNNSKLKPKKVEPKIEVKTASNTNYTTHQYSFTFQKHNVSFLIGNAFALNDFGSTQKNNRAGYAKQSIDLTLAYYTYKLRPNLSFASKINYKNHAYNGNTAINNLIETTDNSWSYSAKGWQIIGLFAGLASNIIINNFQIEGRLLPGVININTPQIKYIEDVTNNKIEVVSTNSTAFAYNIGAGVKVLLTQQIGLQFDIDYMGAKAQINNTKFVTGNGTELPINKKNQEINTLTISIGLFFNLEL